MYHCCPPLPIGLLLAAVAFDAAAVGRSARGRNPSLFGVDWVEVPLPEGQTGGEGMPSDLAVVTPAGPVEALDEIADGFEPAADFDFADRLADLGYLNFNLDGHHRPPDF